jgi:hypothetical protein
MIIKQYTISLPADYDMGIIRARVAKAAAVYDTFPGLHFKAFLIRERGRFGAIGNEYAPFYVWPSTEALWGFVAGDGFRGIIDSFGWIPIRVWLNLDLRTRTDLKRANVRAATREQAPLADGCDLATLRRDEIAGNIAAVEGNPRIVARVVAVNTERWKIVRFTLWSCRQDELPTSATEDSFEVLHLSAPGLH